MFVLSANITIRGKQFRRVHEVEIESDRQVLEDRAVIKLPTTARLERQGQFISEVETAKTFSVGDPVLIQLGYDGALVTEFAGYVRRIKPTVPLEIECEDSMYVLKRKNVQKSWRSVTLKEVLGFLLDDTGFTLLANVPEITFAPFYLRNVSAARALQQLKDKYGLTIYFTTPTELFVGIATDNDGQAVKYRIGENVIENNLEWAEEEEYVKLKIKVVYVRPDNTLVEKEVGDPEGEQRTVFLYDLPNGVDLERRAREELIKYSYAGYRGDITTFLIPVARVGNVARIENALFADQDGDYLIDKVTTTFGQGGGRRKITIGIKV